MGSDRRRSENIPGSRPNSTRVDRVTRTRRAGGGSRTHDLTITSRLRYQLRHTGTAAGSPAPSQVYGPGRPRPASTCENSPDLRCLLRHPLVGRLAPGGRPIRAGGSRGGRQARAAGRIPGLPRRGAPRRRSWWWRSSRSERCRGRPLRRSRARRPPRRRRRGHRRKGARRRLRRTGARRRLRRTGARRRPPAPPIRRRRYRCWWRTRPG